MTVCPDGWLSAAVRQQNPAYRPTRSLTKEVVHRTMAGMRLSSRTLEFSDIRAEFSLPPIGETGFDPDTIAAATNPMDAYADRRTDHTSIEFVTIDPPGAMDLDQALHIAARDGGGWTVYYAIADVAALVVPDGPVAAASLERGHTVYLPDGSVPLHPRELSEDAGSLLPQHNRAAVLWTVQLDRDAGIDSIAVERATVRSRARLTYAEVQNAADDDNLPAPISHLPTVGEALRALGIRAGAINLRLPGQEIDKNDDQTWELRIEPRREADEWNAQISLLVGRCAARLMLDAKVGLLRTLPEAPADTITELRGIAEALRLTWHPDQHLGEFLDAVDVNTPEGLAMMRWSTTALRGAGYTTFNGNPPEITTHAGIGGPYAHVTAPLRRLGDRFATEICLAHVAGHPIPQWVLDQLEQLPAILESTSRTANAVDRACVDLTEAVVMSARVGEQFDVDVLRGAPAPAPDTSHHEGSKDAKKKTHPAGEVFLLEPPVFGTATGPLEQGKRATVTLTVADPVKRRVSFAAAR